MSKPITGTLVWKAKTWQVRVRANNKDAYIDLGTTDKGMARRMQARAVRQFLAGQGTQALDATKRKALKRLEMPAPTMAELAVEFFERRREEGIKHWKNERRWWELHAKRQLGAFEPKNVTPNDIEEVLWEAKGNGLAHKSLICIKGAIQAILRSARKQRLVLEDVSELVDLPRDTDVKKPRVQLTDEEFARYVAHPDTLNFSEAENVRRKARGEVPVIQPRGEDPRHHRPHDRRSQGVRPSRARLVSGGHQRLRRDRNPPGEASAP